MSDKYAVLTTRHSFNEHVLYRPSAFRGHGVIRIDTASKAIQFNDSFWSADIVTGGRGHVFGIFGGTDQSWLWKYRPETNHWQYAWQKGGYGLDGYITAMYYHVAENEEDDRLIIATYDHPITKLYKIHYPLANQPENVMEYIRETKEVYATDYGMTYKIIVKDGHIYTMAREQLSPAVRPRKHNLSDMVRVAQGDVSFDGRAHGFAVTNDYVFIGGKFGTNAGAILRGYNVSNLNFVALSEPLNYTSGTYNLGSNACIHDMAVYDGNLYVALGHDQASDKLEADTINRWTDGHNFTVSQRGRILRMSNSPIAGETWPFATEFREVGFLELTDSLSPFRLFAGEDALYGVNINTLSGSEPQLHKWVNPISGGYHTLNNAQIRNWSTHDYYDDHDKSSVDVMHGLFLVGDYVSELEEPTDPPSDPPPDNGDPPPDNGEPFDPTPTPAPIPPPNVPYYLYPYPVTKTPYDVAQDYLDMYLRTRITATGLYPKPSSVIEGAFHSALFINLQLRDIAYDKVPINLEDKTITFLVRRNKYPVDNDDIIILKTEQDGILVVDEERGLIEIKITSDEMNHIPSDYWYDVQVHDIEEIEEGE